MSKPVTPIFLFSLPRSGSTLIQRVLMAHDKIKSTAEPWIVLPYAHVLNDSDGVLSRYSERGFQKAFKNFVKESPNDGYENYLVSLRDHLTSIYGHHCDNHEVYFLDKTPRYYYCIDDIVKIFPNAKFIFLFRNPLSILNSVLKTFCKNNFKHFARFHNDVFYGQEALISSFKKIKHKSYFLRYEDFVENSNDHLEKILRYLNLEMQDGLIETLHKNRFSTNEMGDPTGQKKYKKIDNTSINSWKINVRNPIRYFFFKSYIRKLGYKLIDEQGYNKEVLMQDLKQVKFGLNGLLKDFYGIIICGLTRKFKLNLSRKINDKWFYS